MDKKLSYYIDNSNFSTPKPSKKEVKAIKKAASSQKNLVKIVNGEIIIDDRDMVITRNEEDMEIVEENEIVTSCTFGKKRCCGKWNKIQTAQFYEALRLCGLEFTLISNLFENKNRRACKLKYLSELKRNKKKIEEILSDLQPFNREKYESLKNQLQNTKM